ncbi:hypothetical protein ACX40Y_06785 [Sphingomonas sp. RS6]
MNKFMLMVASLGVAAAAVPAVAAPIHAPAPHAPAYAQARGWQSINEREARLDKRIDQGVRSGALSRREATALRGEYRSLVRLEARYRASRPGLTMAERRDLDRRFDSLSAKIRIEKRDRNHHRG